MEIGTYKEINGKLEKCEMSEIKKGDIWRVFDCGQLSMRYEALNDAELKEVKPNIFRWSVKPKILR